MNRGKLWTVFPPEINCIPKDLPCNVMVKIAVIAFLSPDPPFRTCFEFLLARVVVDTNICSEGVWSKVTVKDSGMLCFSTFSTI